MIKKKIVWKWQAMDRAMTKAPLGWKKTGNNPTERGKTGTKRSLLTDGNGILIGIAVDGANRHDSQLVKLTLQSIPIKRLKVRPCHQQYLCLDAGYVGDEVAALAKAFGYTSVLAVRRRKSYGRGWVTVRVVEW